MEEIIKSISEKISSYNIFNNLFPGVIFCSVLTKATRFDFASDSVIVQLFIWYFAGMIISRIGSVVVGDFLKKLRINNKPYIIFADYKEYIEASQARPFIVTLSEVNNTYRTVIALLLSMGLVYLYDAVAFELIAEKCSIGNKLTVMIVGIFLIILFIKSYKKQTDFVRKQVEKYMNEKNTVQ